MQVSQGRSTYAEAKVLNTSTSPLPVINNPSDLSPLMSEFIGGTGSNSRAGHKGCTNPGQRVQFKKV